MRNTKEIILEGALHLFNESGFKETTLRKIAMSLGMSQGNLNYHYKAKNDILEELYFNLVEKIDAEVQTMSTPHSLLQMIYDSSKISIRYLYAYRFLMRDLYQIMKSNNKIHNHYMQLQKLRLVQFNQVFQNLIGQGIVRPEAFNNEYKRLSVRMNILGDNWINAQELLNNEVDDPVQYYQSLLFEVIYPYLTKKGKKEYSKIA